MSKQSTEFVLGLDTAGRPILRRDDGMEFYSIHLEFRLEDGRTRAITVSSENPPVEQQPEAPVPPPEGPILRCTWCCKDTKTDPCEHCENDMHITDRTKPHRPEWSRKTIKEVECKVCDRSGPYSIQSESFCDETNNPNIIGRHALNPIQ